MNDTTNVRDEVAAGMQPLFERAKREGLWFYSSYLDLWFTPKELRSAQAIGRFVWGAVNWQLRNPVEKLDDLRALMNRFANEARTFEKRISDEA